MPSEREIFLKLALFMFFRFLRKIKSSILSLGTFGSLPFVMPFRPFVIPSKPNILTFYFPFPEFCFHFSNRFSRHSCQVFPLDPSSGTCSSPTASSSGYFLEEIRGRHARFVTRVFDGGITAADVTACVRTALARFDPQAAHFFIFFLDEVNTALCRASGL
jgi:hypothetical protein